MPLRSVSPRAPRRKLPSLLGWALAISALLHLIALPFFGLRAQAQGRPERQVPTTITIERRPKPTPPPPTPTPQPPKQTAPPVRPAVALQATHPHLRPPKLARRPSENGEHAYVAQGSVADDDVHPGAAATAAPPSAASASAPADPNARDRRLP